MASDISAAEQRLLPRVPISPEDLATDLGHNPFNYGKRIRRYRPDDLHDEEGERTDRTAFFEERLAWLSKRLEGPVPYAFRLADGSTRSLDAGCLGFLFNKRIPEITFEQDVDGYISKVSPTPAFMRRINTLAGKRGKPGYTLEELSTIALRPSLELLIAAARNEALVPYGELANHLRIALKRPGISPRQIGHVAGALMDRLLEIEPDAPLINLLVVRADIEQPGAGATPYLRRRYGLKGRITPARRDRYVAQGIREAWDYDGWPDLYRRLFQADPKPTDAAEQFDFDGQWDNPFHRGQPESPEHARLKRYVLEHPAKLRIGLRKPQGRIERSLPSGDVADVEFIEADRQVAVEVKSVRSGWLDLRRGIFQCVKYRAVLDAQALMLGAASRCESVLVVEKALPTDLAALARKLGVVHRVISVNDAAGSRVAPQP